jgi:hypothetical protein
MGIATNILADRLRRLRAKLEPMAYGLLRRALEIAPAPAYESTVNLDGYEIPVTVSAADEVRAAGAEKAWEFFLEHLAGSPDDAARKFLAELEAHASKQGPRKSWFTAYVARHPVHDPSCFDRWRKLP